LIDGEAGIGKSRLTEVLRERIADEPHVTLRYQCSPFHLNAALYPVITQIELAAGFTRDDTLDQKLDKLESLLISDDAQRADSAPLFAALLSLPTDRYSPFELSPQKRKEKTLEALVGQVEALSRIEPVLMIVEDAHWIDPTSQELLDALVSRLSTLPVMLMVTYRSEQYTPRWTTSALVTSITLTGLTQLQSAELARNVAKGKALPDEVLEQLVMRADGVPLFLEELTKSVLESRLLLEKADRYALLEPLHALAIPSTLKALLIARLDRREGVRELAQVGACIGRVFSYELLGAVSAKTARELDEGLEQLTATELVFRRGTPPDASYTFKHALVQDAAYESLVKTRRQQLHAKIAEALEQKFPQSVANQPELLARHRTEAGHLVAAISLWRRAGESALARVALQESVAYLEKGLALIDRLPPSADRDLLELSVREPLHTARLRWRGWARPEIGVNATAILEVAQRQSRPQSLLVGFWGMWINTITQGRVAETPQWAKKLLTAGEQSGDINLKILGHRALMSSHFYKGELQEALDQRKALLALYDPQRAQRWMELTGNDVRTAAGVFGSQALWMQGYPDKAALLSDSKDDDSRRLGHPFDLGWALTWGGYVSDYRREPDQLLARAHEADRHAREAARQSSVQNIPVIYNVLVPMVEGLALLRKGLLPGAIAALRLGIDGWRTTGGNLNLPYLKSALAEALARQGDVDGAHTLLDECVEQINRPGWHECVWLAEILRLKGWVLMRQGKGAEAEAQLRASIDCARGQNAKSWELRSSTTLAELLLRDRGRRDEARELLKPTYEWFKEGFDTHDLKAARSLLEDLR
jgi:predicted ATPase